MAVPVPVPVSLTVQLRMVGQLIIDICAEKPVVTKCEVIFQKLPGETEECHEKSKSVKSISRLKFAPWTSSTHCRSSRHLKSSLVEAQWCKNEIMAKYDLLFALLDARNTRETNGVSNLRFLQSHWELDLSSDLFHV